MRMLHDQLKTALLIIWAQHKDISVDEAREHIEEDILNDVIDTLDTNFDALNVVHAITEAIS